MIFRYWFCWEVLSAWIHLCILSSILNEELTSLEYFRLVPTTIQYPVFPSREPRPILLYLYLYLSVVFHDKYQSYKNEKIQQGNLPDHYPVSPRLIYPWRPQRASSAAHNLLIFWRAEEKSIKMIRERWYGKGGAGGGGGGWRNVLPGVLAFQSESESTSKVIFCNPQTAKYLTRNEFTHDQIWYFYFWPRIVITVVISLIFWHLVFISGIPGVTSSKCFTWCRPPLLYLFVWYKIKGQPIAACQDTMHSKYTVYSM